MALPTIFDKIIKSLRLVIRSFPDGRTGKSLTCNIEDIVLGAFSVFLIQSPSFLTYQRTMVTLRYLKPLFKGLHYAGTIWDVGDTVTKPGI